MSDNAPTFTCADKLLVELKKRLQSKSKVSALGTEWVFTPTRAPWFGAIYERMIGTLKRELAKMLRGATLTYFELDLHLKEITGILNNRPLTAVGEEEVITPNNILTGRSNSNHNILEVAETDEILQQAMSDRKIVPQLFQHTAKKRETFWRYFRDQYLESIKFEKKPTQESQGISPQVGDVVIMF